VDARASTLVESPQRYGVIVTRQLFRRYSLGPRGGATGGIGFAASANLNRTTIECLDLRARDGAAHDLAGTGRANPLAAISSAALDARTTWAKSTRRFVVAARAWQTLTVTSAALGTAGVTSSYEKV